MTQPVGPRVLQVLCGFKSSICSRDNAIKATQVLTEHMVKDGVIHAFHALGGMAADKTTSNSPCRWKVRKNNRLSDSAALRPIDARLRPERSHRQLPKELQAMQEGSETPPSKLSSKFPFKGLKPPFILRLEAPLEAPFKPFKPPFSLPFEAFEAPFSFGFEALQALQALEGGC